MTALGLSPLGTELGPWGGKNLITILGVVHSGQNEIIVIFDRVPLAKDPAANGDALNPSAYQLVALDPTMQTASGESFVPEGKVVPTISPSVREALQDDLDEKQIVLHTEASMETGVDYMLTVSGISGADGESFAGVNAFTFVGLRQRAKPVFLRILDPEEFLRDLDTQVLPEDKNAIPGTWRVDSTGDIATHGGLSSLKKRLLRRVFTTPGGFAHLPTYGVGVKIKALAKAGRLQTLGNEIAEQARQEPDVLAAAATVTLENRSEGGFITVNLLAQTVSGDTEGVAFAFNPDVL